MALSLSDVARKYKKFHALIAKLKSSIKKTGYNIREEDMLIESGVTFNSKIIFSISGKDIALLRWDAPHILDFENLIGKDFDLETFSIDYGLKLDDWIEILNSIESALIKYMNSESSRANIRTN
ncbi:MAG: hypothetical protein AAB669_00035 [Patescibacteria group bacterium]